MQDNPQLTATRPVLDCDQEPWFGHFPGLGTVLISADGSYEVLVESDAEGAEQALRHGWAEHLAWVRTGGRLSHGAVLVPPDGDRALLLNGDGPELRAMMRALIERQWHVCSDLPAHVRWEGDQLMAQPRSVVLLAQDEADGYPGTPARDDTDTLLVEVPLHAAPVAVAAVATIRGRAPRHEPVRELTGHDRFEAATRTLLRGVLAGDELPADQTLAEHLLLARIPACTILYSSNTEGDPIASLVEWWERQ